MRKSHVIVLACCLAIVAQGAMATSTVYVTEPGFTADLAAGYYLNDFDYDFVNHAAALYYVAPTTSFASGGWAYTVSSTASGGTVWEVLAGSPSVGSLQVAGDLIVTFTGNPVTAVGGLFFGTDAPGAFTPASITVTLSDGTTEGITSTAITDFRGFITTSTPIVSLKISDSTAGTYPALDHLYVGEHAPLVGATVPEPVTMFSAFMAISSLGMYIRKRMKAQVA